MKEKQGAEMGGNNIYLDYMGSKSSFKKDRGGGRGGRGGFGDRSFGRSPAGGHSNSGNFLSAYMQVCSLLNLLDIWLVL